jgi:hypothetical protein
MSKSIRSFILLSSLSLAVVPALSAENMGTDPKPGLRQVAERNIFGYLQFVILSYWGV